MGIHKKLICAIVAFSANSITTTQASDKINDTLTNGYISANKCELSEFRKGISASFICVIGDDGKAVAPGHEFANKAISGGIASSIGLLISYIKDIGFAPVGIINVRLACDLNFEQGATAAIWTDTKTQSKLLSIYSFSEGNLSSIAAKPAQYIFLTETYRNLLPLPSAPSIQILPKNIDKSSASKELEIQAKSLGIYFHGAPNVFKEQIDAQCNALRRGRYSKEVKMIGQVYKLSIDGQIMPSHE